MRHLNIMRIAGTALLAFAIMAGTVLPLMAQTSPAKVTLDAILKEISSFRMARI